ncbi:hypothetical protein BGX28_009039 [Mortierella sp. GBA30]|nr:hypothetical protein BGX28_009039 [Mortierella sp. GBA30]
MSRHQDPPRLIDKRQVFNGTEYLVSTTGEWIASSTSRVIHPELVELYEWLHNSGFRSGTTVFAASAAHKVTSKGARKRLQSAPASPAKRLPEILTQETSDNGAVEGSNTTSLAAEGNHAPQDGTPLYLADEIENGIQDQNNDLHDDSLLPKFKKQRLNGSYVEEMSHLSIEAATEDSGGPPQKDASAASVCAIKDMSPEANGSSTGKTEQAAESGEQQVMPFNKNTEQMIEVYFKEGMDASGVEMFDMLLGPYRRPNKEFVAAFFYAVILSPLTEHATIEAAIHVLDRTLTLHGPEPFEFIWNVQKRRREVSDGTNPFSRQSPLHASASTVDGSSASGMSSRSNGTARDDSTYVGSSLHDAPPTPSGRLPSWNSIWDLIKAEFGLDTRPESKQHIALQEYHIRMRLQGDELNPISSSGRSLQKSEATDIASNTEHDLDDESTAIIKEEQEIRDEIGRAIVGLLLRVLEQDAVLKNLSKTSFFCRHVLQLGPYSSTQSVQQALNVVFQIVGLATSSRYLESSSRSASGTSTPTIRPGRGTTGAAPSNAARSMAPWPLNERCALNAAGAEIMQLGQQLLLLLIRFTQAGQLFSPGKGMEELAREVESRLSKVNRDRKITSSAPFLLERYHLDQTEIFLKLLIQGPSLLDPGTGSGASVRLRKEGLHHLDAHHDTDGTGIDSGYAFGDYNGVLKSQTGISMGSSAFVMYLVDYWFRNRTTSAQSGGAGGILSFRRVLQDYAQPSRVRPALSTTTASVSAAPVAKSSKPVRRGTRKSTRGQKSSMPSDDEGDGGLGEILELTSVQSSAEHGSSTGELAQPEQWKAKDLEELEWTVMMIEVLIWSWVEARGVRKDDLMGTGLDQVLFPDEIVTCSQQSNCSNSNSNAGENTSGWLTMSQLLGKVGGTLKTRWEHLESVIDASVTVEDLNLR